MSIPIPAGPEMVGKTCPGCRMPIQAGAAVMVCPNCKNPHHALCWQKSNGCAVYGCTHRAGAVAPHRPGGQIATCPKCGYIFGPMETTCRRCAAGGAMRTTMGAKPVKSSGMSAWGLLFVVLILLLVAGSIGYLVLSSRDGSVVLSYKFKEGQIDRYRMTADVVMHLPKTPMTPSDLDMHITALSVQKVLSVHSDGSAKIEATMKDAKLTSSSPLLGGQASDIPSETCVYTVSTSGRDIESASKGASVADLGMGMPGMKQLDRTAVLPARGVNVGESWTETLKSPEGVELVITSTLKSMAEVFGRRETQRIDQTYSSEFDLKDLKNSGGGLPFMMSAKCKLTGTGTVYFCQDEGRLVQSESAFKMDFTISSAGIFGSSAKIDVDFKVKVALDE